MLLAMTHRRIPARLALLASLAVAGCAAPGDSPTPEAQTEATIQEVMQIFVDPAADALWDAVSSTVTAHGLEEKRPQTEADWLEQRRQALRLYEGAGLLLAPGRTVAGRGQTLEDAQVAAVLSAAQIDGRIAADPGAFRRRARELQAAARLALDATRARDVAALLRAGSSIDAACERCHLDYWYPGGGPPAARPSPRSG